MFRYGVRVLALALAAAGVVVTGFYLTLLRSEGADVFSAGIAVAVMISGAGLVGAGGALLAPRMLRGAMLGLSAGGLLALSFISLASIGILILPVGVGAVALLVWRIARGGYRWDWACAVAGVLIGVGIVASYVLGSPYREPVCAVHESSAHASVYPAGSIYGAGKIVVTWRCVDGDLADWNHSP